MGIKLGIKLALHYTIFQTTINNSKRILEIQCITVVPPMDN